MTADANIPAAAAGGKRIVDRNPIEPASSASSAAGRRVDRVTGMFESAHLFVGDQQIRLVLVRVDIGRRPIGRIRKHFVGVRQLSMTCDSYPRVIERDTRQAALQDAELTNLSSIEGADFTDVSDLSTQTAEYLASIASGSHPNTYRQTAQTLKNLSISETK